MKIKKFFANIVILAIFAAAVFYIGWITFLVKPGFCAVMSSKTSGIYEKPVMSGAMTWRWERLLPTNVTLETFDLAPFKSTQVVSGELPSSKFYKDFSSEKANFSYNIKLNFTMSISAEEILELYKNNKIRTNDDLLEYYENRAKLAASFVSKSLFDNHNEYLIKPTALSEEEILKILMSNKNEFKGIAFSSVEVSDSVLPDIDVYYSARKAYEEYLSTLKSKMEDKASRQAENILEQDKLASQFEKIGEVMKKYPNLQDLFKNSDAASVLNAVNSIR